MKIGMKLITIISVINIIGIGLLAGFMLFEAEAEIGRLASEQAQTLAAKTGEHLGKWFGEYIDPVRTLAQIMEGYQEIPPEQRRDQFNFMLRQTLIANPALSDVYTNWSPNGLDGMDAEYAHTPGTNETGRFIPAWSMGPDGPAIVAIEGFEWDDLMELPITTDFVFDPFVHPVTNTLSAQMCHPVKDKGRIIGLVGDVIELATIQTIVGDLKPFGDGFALLFSSGGFIIAHRDPLRLGKNVRETEGDTFGPFLDTMVEAVTQGTAASFSYAPPQADTVVQYYAVPFTIGHDPRPWTLVIGISQDTIMAPVYRMLVISLIIGFLTLILMSAGVIITARSISNPIASTMIMLKDIAEGDLTQELTLHSRDELGDMVRFLNFTVERIKHLVLSIRKEAEVLSQTGGDLAANMTETAAAINEITANLQNINVQTGKQEELVQSTDTVMEQMLENIQTLTREIETQTRCVHESSSAVEKLLSNIQSVTQSLVKNEANINKLSQAAQVGYSGLQEVSADIQGIARESEGLLEINEVMENIAGQTNLLSMNAAIEAAHAGAAGKGFAVVADEIRKLAESSGEQSKTIGDVLKRIKDSIDTITKATNEVLQHFEAIRDGVKTVTEQERHIRSAMEEQGTGSKTILESISSLNEITGEVKDRARGMLGGSHEVIEESKALGQISGEISNGMQEMVCGADQINIVVHRVNDISLENKKQIGLLMAEVSRFKVAAPDHP
ncbi:MAG: methyl-accepting chemotaxis protein [Treponema sp.]|nr:methyl-accepting chemotaxis protein [Treponema sp.]